MPGQSKRAVAAMPGTRDSNSCQVTTVVNLARYPKSREIGPHAGVHGRQRDFRGNVLCRVGHVRAHHPEAAAGRTAILMRIAGHRGGSDRPLRALGVTARASATALVLWLVAGSGTATGSRSDPTCHSGVHPGDAATG